MPHEDPQKHSVPKPHRARAGQGAGTPAQSPSAAPAQGAAGTPPGTPGGKSTKTVYTARPGAAAKKAGKKPFRPRKVDIAIAATALVGVAVLVMFFVGFLPTLGAQGASSLASSSQSASFSYASSLAPEKFVGTILPETEDAGMEYAEETLFLGDSNTLRMLYYADVTGVTMANGIGVESMGITTFSTQRCAQFSGVGQVTMPQAVGILQPRRVVLTFGTNNVGMEIDKFIEYYRDAIDAVKDAYAYTDIILGAIFPVDQYRQNEAITMRRIDQMNAALATLAKEEDCKFLNWSEALLDEEIGYCGFEHTIQDGVHLSRAGMEAIFSYFRTHSYITEDARPKPLKSIPDRIGTNPGIVTRDPVKVPGPIDWSRSESSSQSGLVDVCFAAWDETSGAAGGGTVSVGGTSARSVTVAVAPGGTAAAATATPDAGYEFVGWGCTLGSTAGAQGASLSFVVPGNAVPGETLTVTAIFRKLPASSSSSSSSSSSQPPTTTQPETSTQPDPTSQPQPDPTTSTQPDPGTSSTGEEPADAQAAPQQGGASSPTE